MIEHTEKLQFKNCMGEITIVPSKSETHRAVIAAALVNGKSVIKNASICDDTRATIECMRAMGAQIDVSGNVLCITGINFDALNKVDDENVRDSELKKHIPIILNCNESASTMRFLLPTALFLYGDVIIKGSEKLIERGIGVYEEVFGESKVSFYKEKSFIRVTGRITQKNFVVPGNISSQYISGILFMMPMLPYDGKLTITGDLKSAPYVNMTLEMLKRFEITVKHTDNCDLYFVPGNQQYKGAEYTVSGDWSNAAFFVALNHLGAKIKINGLDNNGTQGDKICGALFDKLGRTANTIEKDNSDIANSANLPEFANKSESVSEPDIRYAVIDISNTIDLGPILMAYAAIKNGGIFAGTERLKSKESDRAAVMKEELFKFGINVRIEYDKVTVEKGTLKIPPVPADSHNDHRIAMALTLLLLCTGGDLMGAEAVNKSYPGFFDDLDCIINNKK